MIALNKEWLSNLRIQDEAEKYRDKGFISSTEFDVIRAKYPVGFYMPNVFVRGGLFILTFFVTLMGDGLLTLIATSGGGDSVVESPGWSLFLGVISYACLEGLIAAKKHFRSGVDDALLLVTALLFTGMVFSIAYKSGIGVEYRSQWISFGVFIFTLYFTIRFVDILMAGICCGAFFATIFFFWNNVGFGGLYTAPFIIILVSAGVYWLINPLGKKAELVHYEGCLLIAQIVSLIVLYAAGNYYIVQTLGGEMSPGQPANKPLPLGWFFWSWTMLMPLVYVAFGIKRKNMVLLRLGLLLVIAAVSTFRNYYHILPTDVMLIIAGALVIAVSWAFIRYLKTPKYGFIYDEPSTKTLLDHAQIESLITAQSVANIPAAPASSGSRFGGGDFGGGGSSGSF